MGSMTDNLPWPRLRIKWTDNPAVIREMMTEAWTHGAEWGAAEAAWRKYNGR